MISLWLEKRRKQAQKTVLGVELDNSSLVSVKLKKNPKGLSLVSCDSHLFHEEAYHKNSNHQSFDSKSSICTDYLGGAIAGIIKSNNLSRFTKLGFTLYRDIDVLKAEIKCDRRILNIITENGVDYYIREYFLKNKYSETYLDINFYYEDNSQTKGYITVYYTISGEKIKNMQVIAKKAKKDLAVCTLDDFAICEFINKLYLSEISSSSVNSIFVGLYSDKIFIYSFSSLGNLDNSESIKIFDNGISDIDYAKEATQLLLRFINFMSLDFLSDNFDERCIDKVNIYLYGLKDNFEKIFDLVKQSSAMNCQILDPFKNISMDKYTSSIKQPYRFVIATAIAMREAL